MINVQNVSLGYENVIVAKDISFSIGQGDYLSIIGENGSGKTTLMKALLGLKPQISGEIFFSEGMKRTDIGYIPQQTDAQRDFPASVKEVVISGCLGDMGLRPFYGRAEKNKAYSSMEQLGITHIANSCYRELSGGQQQRVLLARALCAAKKSLLLDEPVAGLDPKATAEIYSIIKELNNKGMAVIMISHDIDAVLSFSSHILHIGKGEVFFGSRESYKTSRLYHGLLSGKEHL